MKKAEQEEFGSRRALDLSEEIAEKERDLRRREEKLRREERKLDEMSRAEKERNLKEREERLRRKEKELEEKSGKSATCYDNWGSREWSRSSDRSSSSKGRLQLKKTGLFGNFSQVSDPPPPPPPFGNPCFQKKKCGLFCILGHLEHFWSSQKCSLFGNYSDIYFWE